MEVALQGESFTEGEKGKDKFEIDGLLVARESKIVLVVEAKKSLRDYHVEQVLSTARNTTLYWDKVVLRSATVVLPKIEECELVHVLVAPYAAPQILAAVANHDEKFVVITESDDNFGILYCSAGLQGLARSSPM